MKKQKSRNVDSVLAMARHWINQGEAVVIHPADNFGFYSTEITQKADVKPNKNKPAYEIGD